MATKQDDSKKKSGGDGAATKPDPETLHTTDPQEHMKGPLSSLMQSTEDGFEEKGSKKGTDD